MKNVERKVAQYKLFQISISNILIVWLSPINSKVVKWSFQNLGQADAFILPIGRNLCSIIMYDIARQ